MRLVAVLSRKFGFLCDASYRAWSWRLRPALTAATATKAGLLLPFEEACSI